MKILIILVFSLFIVQDICKGTQQNANKTNITHPVEDLITKKLTEQFKPIYLDVTNESHLHGEEVGSERHFRILVVSDRFNDKERVERHNMVNGVLAKELEGSLEPPSMLLKTPSEWVEMTKDGKFPDCLNTVVESAE